jgi:hypothetical protein
LKPLRVDVHGRQLHDFGLAGVFKPNRIVVHELEEDCARSKITSFRSQQRNRRSGECHNIAVLKRIQAFR